MTSQQLRLTHDLIREIADAVRGGSPLTAACAGVGVSDANRERWTQRGEKLIRDGRHGITRDFVQTMARAEAEAVANLLECLRGAAARNWQAAAWLLERRFPADFARSESRRIELTGRDGAPVTHSWLNLVNQAEGPGTELDL